MSSSVAQEKMIWNAARMAALGTIGRLDYNRRRYRESSRTDYFVPESEDFDRLISMLIGDIQTYRNMLDRLMSSENEHTSHFAAALVILLQRIGNLLYRLHHDLLECDPAGLEHIIPDLDVEIRLWKFREDNISELESDSDFIREITAADESLRNLDRLGLQLSETLNRH